jgi:hypothetical protein
MEPNEIFDDLDRYYAYKQYQERGVVRRVLDKILRRKAPPEPLPATFRVKLPKQPFAVAVKHLGC